MRIDNIFAKSKYYIDEFLKYKSDMRKKRRLIKKKHPYSSKSTNVDCLEINGKILQDQKIF